MLRTASPPWRSLGPVALLILMGQVPAAGTAAEEKEAPSPLALVEIEVDPPQPGVATLCKLAVRVQNGADRPASELGFEVRLNGRPLEVYRRELFYPVVQANRTTSVRLFNFWTPADGGSRSGDTDDAHDPEGGEDDKLVLDVVLKSARWMAVETTEGTETWSPGTQVPGLPAGARTVLQLAP